MSEFLAEAQVLIRPDTTRFRAELEAALLSATKTPISIPVVATGGAAAAQQDLAVATTQATDAIARENALLAQGGVLLNKEAIAAESDAAAQASLGAARTQQAATTKTLAAVQTAAATSAQKLAFAQEAVVGAASEVGAAQVTLTRSTAAVAAAEKELAAALNAKNIALIDAASQSVRLAEAQALEAESALAAARAQAEHAGTLAAVNKAAIASSASVLGLRGAVLTAGVAFIGATVGFEAGKRAITEASDTLEEFNKTIEVFGGSAQTILDWSNTTARGIGIARVEALRAIGTFGELFRTLGVGPARAAELSRTLVQLSADLASFFNADPSRVLQALQSGLVGQARPLRQFGIFLTEARVKQEALIETGKDNIDSLTQQDRILARYTLILRDAAIASGDFERTQGGLANQTRILKAELSDLSAEAGGVLVPALLLAVRGTNEWVQSLRDLITVSKVTGGAVKELVNSLIPLPGVLDKAGVGTDSLAFKVAKFYSKIVVLGPALTFASIAVDKLGLSADKAAPKLEAVSAAIQDASDRARAATVAPQNQEFGVQQILNRITGFDAAKVRAQIRGDNEELLSILQQEQAFLESQLSRAGVQRRAGLKRKLEQALLGVVQDIASIQKKGADQAKTVAQDAARSQQEADQALLDLLSTRREDVERAGERAQAEGNLAKAIRAEERFQALVKQQIQKIRDQIKDQQARKAAIRQLRIAIQDSRQEEADLRQQRREEAADRRREFLSLDIQIAQATGNVRAEVQARNAEIEFLKQQIRQTRKNSLERKRLILELRQAQKELRELQAEKQKTSDISKQVFFDFLQKQQGFAANLLGNLIPGFATAGLVGGQQPGQQAVTPPSRALTEAAAVTQVQGRGITQGQGDTQTALLRQIRDALFQLTGRTAAPETRYQRATQSAFMDVIGT